MRVSKYCTPGPCFFHIPVYATYGSSGRRPVYHKLQEMSASSTIPFVRSTSGSVTLRILPTSLQIFLCYFAIGLPMAVLPSVVHLQLHFNTVLFFSGFFGALPVACLGLILTSRLILGFGESWLATGSSLWGIARVGQEHTARVISWSGICSYGGLAIGAPLGVWIEKAWGLHGVGLISVAVSCLGLLTAWPIGEVDVPEGEPLAFRQVLNRVFPHGMSLALATTGFGTIASFMVLFYAHRHWTNAAFALTVFGAAFIFARLLFAHSITRWGGFSVARVCLSVEIAGLALLWLAFNPALAFAGAALTGVGFSLVFPALGVEAVNCVTPENRGSALGIFTAFADLSLGLTGPLVGLIVAGLGYSPIFLFAALMAAVSLGLTLILHRRPTIASNLRPTPAD